MEDVESLRKDEYGYVENSMKKLFTARRIFLLSALLFGPFINMLM